MAIQQVRRGPVGASRRRSSSLLSWSPPTLTSPTTINLSTNPASNNIGLAANTDYILVCPASPIVVPSSGGTAIHLYASGAPGTGGARNIKLVGGEIRVDATTFTGDGSGRAFYIEDLVGTCHIEGLWIHGSGVTEGFDFFNGDTTNQYSNNSTVQIQNCRVDSVSSHSNSAVHADTIQVGAAGRLRVDKLTTDNDCQGIFRADGNTGKQAWQECTIRRTNIVAQPNTTNPGRCLWQGDLTNEAIPNGWNMNLDRVYMKNNRDANTIDHLVWPGYDYGTTGLRPTVAGDGSLTWPAGAYITGTLNAGDPPGGDYVTSGGTGAGTGYVSPGYQ